MCTSASGKFITFCIVGGNKDSKVENVVIKYIYWKQWQMYKRNKMAGFGLGHSTNHMYCTKINAALSCPIKKRWVYVRHDTWNKMQVDTFHFLPINESKGGT